ncbi:MAG: acyltransferase [Myxococcales bacterium]
MKRLTLSEGQRAYLDVLRGAAAMVVLLGHGSMLFLNDGLLRQTRVQSVGVLVFFLLSGFLISHSAFNKSSDADYTFGHYFIDRAARIYTAFLPALFFVWLIDLQSLKLLPAPISAERLKQLTWIDNLPRNVNVTTWFGNLFMLQDFPLFQLARRAGVSERSWFIDEFGSGSPFWTISIEWWLYITFGLVVLVHQRRHKPWTVLQLVVLGLVAIEPAYYLIGGVDNCLTLLWLIGMAACWWYGRRASQGRTPFNSQAPNVWYYLVLAAAAVFCMAGRILAVHFERRSSDYIDLQFGVFLATAVFALLFALERVQRVPKWLASASGFLAGYSYSLYLTHASLLTYIYLRYPGRDNDPKLFWYSAAASNILAIGFWWLFERHYPVVNRWLKALVFGPRTTKQSA